MVRPLRIQAPGLWHHVMNRGLARGDIFFDAKDREAFLGLLTEVRARWGVRTHAACLMGNHFHLLVEDVQGSVAGWMRDIIGVHTQRLNLRHERDGPLFRGRFRSRLVQEERYLGELVRYIPQPATVIATALQLHPRNLSAIACRHRRKLDKDEVFRAEVHVVLDRLRADGIERSPRS